MHRPYYDSYSYRYAESQLENDRLRREIRNLNGQISNLKVFNQDLKNTGTKEALKAAEITRFQSSRINNLEYLNTDLQGELVKSKRDSSFKTKKLNEELNRTQGRVNNLEWLNNELRKEKTMVSKTATDLRYQNATLSTENYRKQRAIEEERKRVSLLESRVSNLNTSVYAKELETKEKERKISQLQYQNATLNSSNYAKELQLKSNTDKIVTLEKRNTTLLSDNYVTRKQLEKERLNASSLSLRNSTLNRSLDLERKTATNLRAQNSTLLSENALKARKLRQNEEMFRSVYAERAAALDATRKAFITAEKNLELSRVDPASYEYSYLDRKYEALKAEQSVLEQEKTLREIREKLSESTAMPAAPKPEPQQEDLNSSTAFTEYYENKYGKSSKLYEDLERDLRMYRIEQSLNNSLNRLRKWSQQS